MTLNEFIELLSAQVESGRFNGGEIVLLEHPDGGSPRHVTGGYSYKFRENRRDAPLPSIVLHTGD